MHVRAHLFLELELLLTLLSLILAFRAPQFSLPAFRLLLRCLRRLANRPILSGVLVAALPLALRAVLLPWIPVPQPQIQEEFSYLLGADTFAHGRLANPAHSMAIFFDNIQVIQTPHYASARLPGQALLLALGEAVFHLPWMGVFLSVGLMCAAFYWMLRAWTPPAWALLASLLFAIRFGVFTYWMNSYWGGSMIALGGALVLGALPRILREQRLEQNQQICILRHERRTGCFTKKNPPSHGSAGYTYADSALTDAFLYALGCCLLAANRPYEGVFFVLPTVAVIAGRWWKTPSGEKLRYLPPFAAAACLLGAYLGWFAYYNHATTGDPLQTAYSLWRKQQSIVPAFWWQPLRRVLPAYYSAQTYQFNAVWEVGIYRDLHRNLLSGASSMAWRLVQFLQLYLRPLLLLPLLAGAARVDSWIAKGRRVARYPQLPNGLWLAFGLAAVLIGHSLMLTAIFFLWGLLRILPRRSTHGVSARRRWGRGIPIILLLAGGLCAVLTNFSMPTYYAHFTAPAFLLVAAGLVSLASWRRREGIGPAIVLNLSFCCCLIFLFSAVLAVMHVHVVHESPFNWSSYENRLEDRVTTQRFLDKQPGQQLAIVRYGPQHDALDEWVWNLADIDAQKVVWARELKPEWTAQLVHSYRDREIWLVEPDAGRIVPYPAGTLPAPGELPALTYTK